MFTRHWMILITALVTLAVMPAVTVAQDESSTCPAIVERALTEIGNNCQDMGRNSVCYGYYRVDATFTEIMAEDFFSRPADMADLTQLQTITTQPLDTDLDQWGIAVVKAQANIPDTLPGQSVTFLLLGDTTMENVVVPEQPPTVASETVEIVVNTNVNVRSAPSPLANLVGDVQSGAVLPCTGASLEGDWLQVFFMGEPAWISRHAVQTNDDLNRLQVVAGAQYAPMQAFRFETGIARPTCPEMPPSAVIVQSPSQTMVTLAVNGAEITLASTVALQSTPQNTMRLSTLDGSAWLDGGRTIVPAGFTIEAPLSNGQVAGDWQNFRAMTPGELNGFLPLQHIPNAVLRYPIQIPTPAQIAALQPQARPQPQATAVVVVPTPMPPCTIRTDQVNAVGIHVGPGYNRSIITWLPADRDIDVLGYAEAVDGSLWWKVDKNQAAPHSAASETWVAQSEVMSHGNCDLAAVDQANVPPIIIQMTPTRPPPPTPEPAEPDEPQPVVEDYYINFRADDYELNRGDCTYVRWDVEHIDSVFYEGHGTVGHAEAYECPDSTKTYELRVVLRGGQNVYRNLTIDVTDSAEPDLGTGDVQMTLRWDSRADIDLHVIDPRGEEIAFYNPYSSSGGQLDVDANFPCGQNMFYVENIFWPTGRAPSGMYQVFVRELSLCGDSSPTWELTVRVDGRTVLVETGRGDSRTYTVHR